MLPDAIFGIHVGVTPAETGVITYRANGFMAAADQFRIVVRGRQTHGATPWDGVDPVVAASYVVAGLQTSINYGVMGFTPSFLIAHYQLSQATTAVQFGLLAAALGFLVNAAVAAREQV